jgi:hypothetical protein
MTIFILPARLKLLHFQKVQLPLVAHALIKACLLSDTTEYVNFLSQAFGLRTVTGPNTSSFYSPSYFFSYTENSYEISIVASVEGIENDFLPLLSSDSFSGVQVSQDVYRVLQVDDEGGQG